MNPFKFDLKETVSLLSGESGTIRGRAEYADGEENSYYVRYVAADGRLVQAWWGESAIVATGNILKAA